MKNGSVYFFSSLYASVFFFLPQPHTQALLSLSTQTLALHGRILEENNHMERNGVDTFGTQDCFVPFQRKGNCLRTFHRNETVHSKPRERIWLSASHCSKPRE
jgi:hypothetical protein